MVVVVLLVIYCYMFTIFGMDSGSLLKAIMGPVEVNILLSLGGWLSYGQSCHIPFFIFYKMHFINMKKYHFIKNDIKDSITCKKISNFQIFLDLCLVKLLFVLKNYFLFIKFLIFVLLNLQAK